MSPRCSRERERCAGNQIGGDTFRRCTAVVVFMLAASTQGTPTFVFDRSLFSSHCGTTVRLYLAVCAHASSQRPRPPPTGSVPDGGALDGSTGAVAAGPTPPVELEVAAAVAVHGAGKRPRHLRSSFSGAGVGAGADAGATTALPAEHRWPSGASRSAGTLDGGAAAAAVQGRRSLSDTEAYVDSTEVREKTKKSERGWSARWD